MLKAITLWEPWATMMAIGAKVNETRGQRIHHRGPIAIHAAKNKGGASDEVTNAAIQAFHKRGLEPKFNFGCIVAVVDLYECRMSEDFGFEGVDKELIFVNNDEAGFGDYSPGRFIYRTRDLRPLPKPIPASGCQALHWTLPDSIEAEVRQQLLSVPAQCCFGACTPNRCSNRAVWRGVFKNYATDLVWCDEHKVEPHPSEQDHSLKKIIP
jgi:hypothetical protein